MVGHHVSSLGETGNMFLTAVLVANPGTRGSTSAPPHRATAFTTILGHWYPYVIPNNQTPKLVLDRACVLCLHRATFRDVQAKNASPQGCILYS